MPSAAQATQNNNKQQEISSKTSRFCYLDFDINRYRQRHALTAAFVAATNTRYGFTSKDLRLLGGGELKRIPDSIRADHEWSTKLADNDAGSSAAAAAVVTRPPPAGNRIVVELFWSVSPLACENFATLCFNGSSTVLTGDGAVISGSKPKPPAIGECGKPLTYRNSIVHRIVPGFIVQCGDFVFGNGSGGESIYNGKKFKDEKNGLNKKHSRRGILSMGNSGKNSNTSQFFITFDKAPQCDGKHVIFGHVVSGWEVLDAIEKCGADDGTPTCPVEITDCGTWIPFHTPGAGYWYDQPDSESFTGISPVFIVRPRIALLAPNRSVADKFSKCLLGLCSIVATIVVGDGDESNADEAMSRVADLLTKFAVDVVLAAPALLALAGKIETPISWTERKERYTCSASSKGEVILVEKPVDALSAIQTKSWLATAKKIQSSWQLDGNWQ